jgi:hypothetical protein
VAVRVLADEMGQGSLRLGPDAGGDPRRDKVQGHDLAAAVAGQRIRELEGQLGMRTAADWHQDSPYLGRAALFDDGDVAGRIAHDLVDRRAEDRRLRSGLGRRRLAAPAEDD